MEKSKVVIYGIGKLAEYMSYIISQDSVHKVSAFCIEADLKIENVQNLGGLPIVDFENLEQNFPPDEYQLCIAIGNNWVRERIFKISKRKSYSFISYLSSKATLWENLKSGENVFIGEGSIVQPFVSIGDNTIVLGAKIGHHSIIGNNVLLSGCYLAGNVKIEDNSFLGLNSTVKQNIIISRNNIIGMGSNITKNTNDGEVYSNEKTTRKRIISSERFKNKYLR